jgi:hypothetical protein
MAENTLTGLMPDLYEALDVVSRELVGFIPAVSHNMDISRAAVGQTINSFVTPVNGTLTDNTPSMTLSEPTAQTIAPKPLTISKSKSVEFGWTGAGQSQMNSGGPGYARIRQDQMIQAMRALTNAVEVDLGLLHLGASRAYGSATMPFATTLQDTAEVRKILADNGQWHPGDMQMVINTAAGAKVRQLTQLTKANEAADSTFLRQGELLDVHGFSMRESAAVAAVTAVGTNTAPYTANGAHLAGATTITLAGVSGTILAGDVITFSNDTTLKYVVVSGCSAAGDIVIGAPGLMKALAGGETVAVTAVTARNMAFSRSSIVLATRMPEMPEEGDAAEDGGIITDPRSGLSFEVLMYKGRRKVRYELGLAWGVSCQKTEGVALLLGS